MKIRLCVDFIAMARININKRNRKKIFDEWCRIKGMPIKQLTKKHKVSYEGVRKLIKKFGENCILEDLPKSGRKHGPSNSELDRRVVKMSERNPMLSIRDTAKKSANKKDV